jgi:hypothetical protein
MTTQQKLTEAENAYHDLMMGRAVRVVVDQNNERVEYTTANASRLYAYIAALKQQLATGKDAFRTAPPAGMIL